MIRHVLFALLLTVAVPGCGPKEARDPSEIIAEDPDFMPPEYEPKPPEERSRAEAKQDRLATRAECEAAARHLEELGLDIAAAESGSEESPGELAHRRRELLATAAARERIERATIDCLGRETSAREATCVARVRAIDEIESCTR